MSNSAAAAQEPAVVSKKPKGDAFRQQKMTAWQPIMTPLKVVLVFMAIGIAFIPTGTTLIKKSEAVTEITHIYDGSGAEVDCTITKQNQGRACSLQFTFDETLKDTTLYVYYELTNFYQNHRRYVGSLSTSQLMGENVDESTLATACDPKTKNGTLVLNPCGLIANSFFNDKFTFTGSNGKVWSETGIAWPTDKDKFKQPKGFAFKEGSITDSCSSVGLPTGCKDYKDTSKNKDYKFWYPNDDKVQYLYESYPNAISPLEGVTNEHFMVWMRTASLPTFRKLYGKITGTFQAGEKITFNIENNFEVSSFQGTKAIVIR